MPNNDLIPRAAARDVINTWGRHENEDVRMDLLHNDINAIPAVEAAPVVRCRDCKYAHLTYDGECKYCDFWQEDGGEALYLDGGFFCAAGERKDGGDA